jgi:hypothetical protein
MKKLFYIFILALCFINLNGQITSAGQLSYDAYSSSRLNIIQLSTGYKYLEVKDSSNSSFTQNFKFLKIYDLNFNLEKTITIPQNISWPGWGSAYPAGYASGATESGFLISDHLFNNDANIEFIIAYRANDGNSCFMGGHDTTALYVMSENGTILHTFDIGDINCNSSSTGAINYYSDGSTFSKLIIKQPLGSIDIYNLPGFLPCETCVSSIGIKNTTNGSNADGMRIGVYPNPSANEFVFQYELPKSKNTGELIITNLNGVIVKTTNINNQTGSISINMSELSSGVYIYKLKSGERYSNPQKIILTK